jgi:hypothetical protein
MQPLPPSCCPCHPHAAPATLMQPLPPACGPCRPHAAPAALMRPLPPSCGPCRPHMAPAANMRLLPSSCGPCQRSSRSLAVRRLRTSPLPLLLQPRPQLPCRVRRSRVWGGPCSGPESIAVSSGKSSNAWGEIHQRSAYINQYLFCTQ